MAARFQLVGALLDLLFQPRIGFLQLARHGVELVRECLELVPGLDGDALAEVAATEPCGTCLQRLDRADHPAGEKHPGEHGKAERAQEHEAEPLQRRVKRGIGFLGRELDEHQPAQRRDLRMSTLRPSMFSASCTVSVGLSLVPAPPDALARAARTCASFDMSVLRSTRLISGCAISRPCASTT